MYRKAQLFLQFLATLTLMTLGAVGCTSIPPSTSPVAPPPEVTQSAPGEPSTLRIGHTNILDTVNPGNAWVNWAARYLWYDTVVDWAGYNSFGPGLAEKWDISNDGLVWTFKIREGVSFHDGTPCTAKEIAWNFNWQMENKLGTTSGYFEDIEEVVALDATTLQITLTQPVGNMISMKLPLVWILAPSVWNSVPSDGIANFEDISAATGTGPYKLVEYVAGEYMILDANKDYWRTPPPFDRVIWRQYATEDALVRALLSGEIDVIHFVPAIAVPTLQEAEDVEVAIMKFNQINVLAINSHENGTQPESLNDPAVRLAIAYSIDKQQIINVAYPYGESGAALVPPFMGDYHNSSIVDIPSDPNEGNRILEEAGYTDRNSDGIREDAKGKPMVYRLYTLDGSSWARVAEIISNGLAQIGISTDLEIMDETTIASRVYPNFDYDLIYWYWGLDLPDPNAALRLLRCDERLPGGWNETGYCNEKYEDLYREQARTLDHGRRRELVWAMQEMIFQERPYIVIVYPPFIQAYNKDRFTFSQECGNILWKACFLKAKSIP
jgi:peptide/nickel transport system substrate-binding protein